MKQYTVYVCETCGYECKNFEEMRKHEANHLGLTVEQLESYISLQGFITYLKKSYEMKNTEFIKSCLDEAIEKLNAFEKEHGLSKDTNHKNILL